MAAAGRATGIGTLLLDAALARAKERGCRVLSLSTNERNPALRLYERAAFSAARARWGGARQLWLERRLVD